MAERPKWLSRLTGQAPRRPKVPDGVRVYAVGDIHGRRDLLERLLELVWSDAAQTDERNKLVFLGDYVDRGPSSREVVDYLMALERPGWEIVSLRGNHEHFFLEFLQNPEVYRIWREFGGGETLRSYGVRPPSFDNLEEFARAREKLATNVPASHLQFLKTLPLSFSAGDYMFVHAGVRPGIALERQSPEDLMWIRDEFLLSDRVLDKIIVHGHTPGERPVVRPNRICVDTGAYATDCLTAVTLSGERCTFLSTSET